MSGNARELAIHRPRGFENNAHGLRDVEMDALRVWVSNKENGSYNIW